MVCNICCYAGSGQHVDDECVPRWRLRCQREAELNILSTKLADLSKSMLDKVRQCTRKLAASTAGAHLVAEVCKLGHACNLRNLPAVQALYQAVIAQMLPPTYIFLHHCNQVTSINNALHGPLELFGCGTG